jgi:hypothetical protein
LYIRRERLVRRNSDRLASAQWFASIIVASVFEGIVDHSEINARTQEQEERIWVFSRS